MRKLITTLLVAPLLCATALGAAAEKLAVNVWTNGVVAQPTNFWTANSNDINAVVTHPTVAPGRIYNFNLNDFIVLQNTNVSLAVSDLALKLAQKASTNQLTAATNQLYNSILAYLLANYAKLSDLSTLASTNYVNNATNFYNFVATNIATWAAQVATNSIPVHNVTAGSNVTVQINSKTATINADVSLKHLEMMSNYFTPIFATTDTLPLSAPRGWNGWYINEAAGATEANVMAAADFLTTNGLADAGWRYVVIDYGWTLPANDASARIDGVIQADPAKFPSGMPAVVAALKARGLKVGLATATGGTHMGLTASGGYIEQDVQTFAGWGIDFVKLGVSEQTQDGQMLALRAWYKAIEASGKPILTYALILNGQMNPLVMRLANSYRWVDNVLPGYYVRSRDSILAVGSYPWLYARDHRFADFDALNFYSPGSPAVNYGAWRTSVGMAAMLNAQMFWPTHIIPTNNLSTMLSIAKNADIMAIADTPVPAVCVSTNSGVYTWVKSMPDGSKVVAFMNGNLSGSESCSISWTNIGLPAGVMTVRNAYSASTYNATNSTSVVVPGVDVAVLRISIPTAVAGQVYVAAGANITVATNGGLYTIAGTVSQSDIGNLQAQIDELTGGPTNGVTSATVTNIATGLDSTLSSNLTALIETKAAITNLPVVAAGTAVVVETNNNVYTVNAQQDGVGHYVAAGTNITASTNFGVVTVNATVSNISSNQVAAGTDAAYRQDTVGHYAAQGTNVVLTTNGNVVTINATAAGGTGSATNAWTLNGNNVTAGQFLGSTNTEPVVIKAGGEVLGTLEHNNPDGTKQARISFGQNNSVEAARSTISGGKDSRIAPGGENNTIVGGVNHLIGTNAAESSILGGSFGQIGNGVQHGAVVGGFDNQVAGDNSVAMGYRSRANHSGSFIFSDDQDPADFFTTVTNREFAIRAQNGFRLVSSGSGLSIDGPIEATGGYPTNLFEVTDLFGNLALNLSTNGILYVNGTNVATGVGGGASAPGYNLVNTLTNGVAVVDLGSGNIMLTNTGPAISISNAGWGIDIIQLSTNMIALSNTVAGGQAQLPDGIVTNNATFAVTLKAPLTVTNAPITIQNSGNTELFLDNMDGSGNVEIVGTLPTSSPNTDVFNIIGMNDSGEVGRIEFLNGTNNLNGRIDLQVSDELGYQTWTFDGATARAMGIWSGTFIGGAADLTNLNASAISSGTVPIARLSGITSNQIDAATDSAYRGGGQYVIAGSGLTGSTNGSVVTLTSSGQNYVAAGNGITTTTNGAVVTVATTADTPAWNLVNTNWGISIHTNASNQILLSNSVPAGAVTTGNSPWDGAFLVRSGGANNWSQSGSTLTNVPVSALVGWSISTNVTFLGGTNDIVGLRDLYARNASLSNVALTNADGTIYWAGRSIISSPVDGVVQLNNYAANAFTGLRLGPAYSTNVFLKNKGNGTIVFRNGNDSADAKLEGDGVYLYNLQASRVGDGAYLGGGSVQITNTDQQHFGLTAGSWAAPKIISSEPYGGGGFWGDGGGITNLNAESLLWGTIPIGRIGIGVPDANYVFFGDNQWRVAPWMAATNGSATGTIQLNGMTVTKSGNAVLMTWGDQQISLDEADGSALNAAVKILGRLTAGALQTGQFVTTSNNFSSASTVFPISSGEQTCVAAGNLTINGFSGWRGGGRNEASLTFIPNGSNRTITLPQSVRTMDGTRSLTSTNNTVTTIIFWGIPNVYTNASWAHHL